MGYCHRAGLAVLIVLCLSSCKEEPDFLSGNCIDHVNGLNSSQLLVSDIERTSLESYYCVVYDVADNHRLKLDIINFSGNCAGPMGGTIHVRSPNEVVLKIKRQSVCNVAADCMCPYDMSLEVKGVATDKALTVKIEHLECDGERNDCYDIATLPVDRASQGMACQNGGRWCDMSVVDAGENDVGCGDAGVCVNLDVIEGAESGLCLADCLETADCPRADIGLHACVDGYCQIANSLDRTCE